MELTSEQKKEIQEQQSQSNTTKRVTSPELEKVLYEAIPVLDHGFIRVIDYMGDDSSIVQSARVSYGKGTKKVSTDEGLIRYLMRHWHSTPFEMCEIKYHVKLPIFIARQWIRHRTANVNEYSARYSILDKEFYIPAKEQLSAQATNNRQGRGGCGELVFCVVEPATSGCFAIFKSILHNRGAACTAQGGLLATCGYGNASGCGCAT